MPPDDRDGGVAYLSINGCAVMVCYPRVTVTGSEHLSGSNQSSKIIGHDTAQRRFHFPLYTAAMRLLFTLILVLGVLAFGTTAAAASALAPHESTARFEIDFLQDMMDHHAMAVETADLCLRNGVAFCSGWPIMRITPLAVRYSQGATR